MVLKEYNDHIEREVICDTMLELLETFRIFKLSEISEDRKTITIQEECDQCFSIDLDKNRMQVLIKELQEISDKMV